MPGFHTLHTPRGTISGPVGITAADIDRPARAATDLDAIVEHQLSWEAHVAAGRIGKGPQPSPKWEACMLDLERILGIGRVGRW